MAASCILNFFQYFCIAVALLVPVVCKLYTSSRRCHFYLKMVFYMCYVMATSFLIIVFAVRDPFNPDNTRTIGGWLLFHIFKVDKFLGITIEERGLENFAIDGPFIIACNHQSSLDLIPMFHSAPKRCTGMGKRELLFAGPFGFAALLCGGVFVDRRPGQARTTMDKVARDMKDKNFRLWMFPEGTRNHTSGMLPFKKGAFHLALQAGIPIVPVVVSSYKSYYDKKTYKFEDGKMIITVLPAVSQKPYSLETVQEYADTVRTQMLKVFESTSAEAALKHH
ncbi:putative 1-acyl-sn-glycerol-3-phosphate acyltransferase alpha [Hypsibius exemplaris]|uniref:1-acyl-sn-glycerol-3-phosphate acyltransferase n=1 Tax=Hypsibius exemplaris TaxID=2072580 RepID=A0A1W0WBN8_HYPEX|nr:putative 1-acyl-sn-glycerol-3-phosphate acyltransferase alpha [Hypsibius exemplaris]